MYTFHGSKAEIKLTTTTTSITNIFNILYFNKLNLFVYNHYCLYYYYYLQCRYLFILPLLFTVSLFIHTSLHSCYQNIILLTLLI